MEVITKMTEISNSTRPLPDINDELYAPYFQALQNNMLVVQQCEKCGHWQWPAREFCFYCHCTRLGWREIKQNGFIYTYTVVYRAFHPWFKNCLPYGIVIVELEKGIRMLGNYFGSDVESLECGMPMKAAFEKVHDEITVLNWVKDHQKISKTKNG